MQIIVPIFEEISMLVTQIIAKFQTDQVTLQSVNLEIEVLVNGKLEKRFEGQWAQRQDNHKIQSIIARFDQQEQVINCGIADRGKQRSVRIAMIKDSQNLWSLVKGCQSTYLLNVLNVNTMSATTMNQINEVYRSLQQQHPLVSQTRKVSPANIQGSHLAKSHSAILDLFNSQQHLNQTVIEEHSSLELQSKKYLFDRAQAAIQKQRDKLRQNTYISTSSYAFKENIPPYQGIRQSQRFIKIQKKLESIKNNKREQQRLNEDEDCEVEVAEEREDHQRNGITHHQILKVREHGLFPKKTIQKTRNQVQSVINKPKNSETMLHFLTSKVVSPTMSLVSDEDEDECILQLSKTQHVRRLPMVSSVMLINHQLNNKYQDDSEVVVQEYSDIADIIKESNHAKIDMCENVHESEDDGKGGPGKLHGENRQLFSKNVAARMKRRGYAEYIEERESVEAPVGNRRLTDLHEARIRNKSNKTRLLKGSRSSIDFHIMAGHNTRKNNEQGSFKNETLLDTINLNQSISRTNGLEESIKAVKSLLSFKKENNNFTIVSKPPQLNIDKIKIQVTGTSILFKEHKRRSLLSCQSEKVIPVIKPSCAPTVKLNLIPARNNYLPKQNHLQDRRLQRHSSTTMSFQNPHCIMSQNASLVLSQNQENLQEFFQLYENFKVEGNSNSQERGDSRAKMRAQQLQKMKSQSFVVQ